MVLTFDVGKARTFLYYLSRANRKLGERDVARQKVRIAIKRLKRISTKEVQKDIEELERRIAKALEMEKRIVAARHDDDVEHNELLEKIDTLQVKLARYLDTSDARQKRIRDLEDKILKATQPKVYEMLKLKEGLVTLEREYQEEKSSGAHNPDDLKVIENRIAELKERLNQLEKSVR